MQFHRRRIGCKRLFSFGLSAIALGAVALSGCGGREFIAEVVSEAREELNLQPAMRHIGDESPKEQKTTQVVSLNPKRENPFAFGGDYAVAVSQPETELSDLRVMGFAKTDQPRVVLRVRQQIATLGVGESFGGVEVIEVNPPSVNLKVGKNIWTASLFDGSPGANTAATRSTGSKSSPGR